MQLSQPQSVPIYVGNLAQDVTEGMLFEIFKRCGNVNTIRVCRDYITKRSLGYAYINFYTVNDAQRAIDTLNNTQIKGKYCRIMWSKRDPSERKIGKGNIFIKGLGPLVGPKELHDTFSQFGNITSCKVASTPTGESKGFGYVHFENPDNAAKAIEIVNGKKIANSIVVVELFKPRQERSQNLGSSWTNVFVKNIDKTVSDEEFIELFSAHGAITSHKIIYNEKYQRKLGFINFENNKMAVEAVKSLNQFPYKGLELYVARHMKKIRKI
jgi:polyadenylate-binding protein